MKKIIIKFLIFVFIFINNFAINTEQITYIKDGGSTYTIYFTEDSHVLRFSKQDVPDLFKLIDEAVNKVREVKIN